jgi:hypothetical protein
MIVKRKNYKKPYSLNIEINIWNSNILMIWPYMVRPCLHPDLLKSFVSCGSGTHFAKRMRGMQEGRQLEGKKKSGENLVKE